VKPIVFGNVARSFGKKREDDGHTHQWTVYVKPYSNECLSSYVKKIHFKLHESYANPNRIVTKPPYEVTETGWGEFEVVIKIYFHDPTERPVTIYHILKLFQSPVLDPNVLGPIIPTINPADKKGLVSEYYDEIVFQEPTQLMQQLLSNIQPVTSGHYSHDTDCKISDYILCKKNYSNFQNFSSTVEMKKRKSLENILDVKVKVKAEIAEYKEKLKIARAQIADYKNQLATVKQETQ
jgi:YEATS domain-containing protein 4